MGAIKQDSHSILQEFVLQNQIKKPFTEQDFAERLARKRIYHPKEFDQEIKDVNAGNFKYQIPSTLPQRRLLKGSPYTFSSSQDIIESYNQAFKSRTYLDAMKNYELRQQYPERYAPAGFESLQNLDIYAERGRVLQRRGVLGRRRSQSLGGEQAQQQETL